MYFVTILYILVLSIGSLLGNNPVSVEAKPFRNPITLDGVLDEKEWEIAAKIVDFYTFQPVDGYPAGERTAALIGYDRSSLYLAIICFYDEPDKIRASICKRDDIFDDDFVIFYLDTFNDGKSAYQFGFNPYGIQADGILTEHVGEDFNPDFIFSSKGRLFQKGYIIEAAIPFKSLRFDARDPVEWGMAILRRTQYLNHDVIWPAISLNSTRFVGQFGHLLNLSMIKPGNRIEVLPELAALQQGELRTGSSPESPGKTSFENDPIEAEIGLNLKLGISAALTLDITANPDFSQIEADANKIDVNRRYPLYYEEKRPFFMEGTDIFHTPIEVLYTRQMADPLAGIKLTGRSGDYSIGILSEIDRYEGSPEYLEDVFTSGEIIDTYKNEKTLNNVIRIKRNILENSFIGLIATDRELKDSYNRLAGLDGSFTFMNNYHFAMQALYAQTRTMDGREVEDPAFEFSFYHGTRNLKIQAYYQDIDTNFIAENGFIRRTDFREGGTRIWYDFLWTEKRLQRFQPMIDYYRTYDHGGDLEEEQIKPSLNFTFTNKTDLFLDYYYQMEEYYGRTFYKNSFAVYLLNSWLAWLNGSIYYVRGDEIFYSADPFLGSNVYVMTTLTWKPTKSISQDFSARMYNFYGSDQGYRYDLTQNIYRWRANWQLTRSLSLRCILEHIDLDYRDTVFDPYDNRDLEVNLLLSWYPSPGTVFFFGMNDYQNYEKPYDKGWLLKHFRRQQRGFFAKFSYLFRF